jgi:hypothetical protein
MLVVANYLRGLFFVPWARAQAHDLVSRGGYFVTLLVAGDRAPHETRKTLDYAEALAERAEGFTDRDSPPIDVYFPPCHVDITERR